MSEQTGMLLKPFVVDLHSADEGYVPILGKQNAAALKSGFVSLKPGESVGSHTTGSREELIIVLEGEGVIETDRSAAKNITRGQAAYNPPETQHDVKNTGTEMLRYVYVVTECGCR